VLTEDRILWANGSSIDFFFKDGSGLGTIIGTSGLGSTIWLALAKDQIAWVNWDSSIVRGLVLEPPGSAPFTIADVPPQGEPVASYYGRITAFGDYTYWATQVPAAVWRALSDGSGPLEDVATGGSPEGVGVSPSHVYWADHNAGQILRTTTFPLGPTEVFAQTSGSPTALLVRDEVVYWVTGGGAVQSKATSAALAEPPFTHALDPQGVSKAITVDADFVYWTVYRNELQGGQGEVKRAPKGSTAAVTLATGVPYFFEIAVDCGSIYWNTNNLDGGEPGTLYRMPHPY
jgi:hypothetical protein